MSKDISYELRLSSLSGNRQRFRFPERTYEFVSLIHDSHTHQELCDYLLRYTSTFGGTRLLCGFVPTPGLGQRDQLAHVLLDAWPPEWSKRYFSSGYLYRDPAIRLVNRGSHPFLWSKIGELLTVPAQGQRILQEAMDFRLREGLTLAFFSVEGRAIGFSLAGEYLELDPRQYGSVQLLAAYALGRALELSGRSVARPMALLSRRQREVLFWASKGLKPNEIADRLGISDHTADMHLRVVRQKLGVASTAHAVAEGLRFGLII